MKVHPFVSPRCPSRRGSGLLGQLAEPAEVSVEDVGEDRPKEEILSYAEQEGESEGEEGEQGEKKKRGGGTPWWDNPLVVVAAGLAFVVGTGALIEAVDDEDDDEDNDGSQSGP